MINNFESEIINSDQANHDRIINFTKNIKNSINGNIITIYFVIHVFYKFICLEFTKNQKESIKLMSAESKAHAQLHLQSVEHMKSEISSIRDEMELYRSDLGNKIDSLKGKFQSKNIYKVS